MSAEEETDWFHYNLTYILEGVLLLFIALVGLTGNIISFVTILSQKVQKTFHNLLFLLTIFDMVSVKNFNLKYISKFIL